MISLLKPAALIAAVVTMLFATAAQATYCTNGATNYPTCTPPAVSTVPSSSTSTSAAAAGATAGAVAQQGQVQGQQQGQQQSQQASGGTLSDSSSARMYVLPAPVFTPPMARVDCPTPTIENRALAIGWGFLSVARGDTKTDDCTAIAMRNAYVDSCQYASAKQVQDLLSARAVPGFKASDTVYLDLTRAECDALRAPPLPLPQQSSLRYELLLDELQSAPEKPKPVKKKRAAKPARTCLKLKTSTDGLCMAPWNHAQKLT